MHKDTASLDLAAGQILADAAFSNSARVKGTHEALAWKRSSNMPASVRIDTLRRFNGSTGKTDGCFSSRADSTT